MSFDDMVVVSVVGEPKIEDGNPTGYTQPTQITINPK